MDQQPIYYKEGFFGPLDAPVRIYGRGKALTARFERGAVIG